MGAGKGPEFERHLGLFSALAIGMGTMIGAGIFVLTGPAARAAGPAAVFSFLIAGGVIFLTACSCAELATAVPRSGGPYAFVHEAFGPGIGFVTGWSLWWGLGLAMAFYCVGFSQYLTYLLPWFPVRSGSFAVAAGILTINLIGGKSGGRLQTLVVAALCGALVIYVLLGLPRVDHTLHAPFFPFGWEPVLRAAAAVFVSYLGFELIATAAEEVRNPDVTLPLATLLSVASVTVLYVLIVYIATGVMSYFDLGVSRTPIADAAARFLGPGGARLIALAGLLATLSSANASVMAAARVSFAMSRDGLLWPWLQDLHPRWRSPVKSTLATGAITAGALWWGDGRALAEAAGFLHLYPFLLVNLAVLVLRQAPGYEAPFRVPGGPVVPFAAALTTLWLISQVHRADALRAAALVAPGLVILFMRRGRR